MQGLLEHHKDYFLDLFQQLDTDRNGSVSQKEFVDHYMDNFLALEEQRVQFMYQIIETHKQLKEIEYQEAIAEQTEKLTSQEIIPDAKLKITIVDAQQLDPNDSYFVVAE